MSRDDDGPGLGGILLGLGALAAGGYAVYKAIKNGNNQNQDKPPQIEHQRKIISPSDYIDLLDFNVDYIDSLHVAYCRAIPAMAALFSGAGFINIRKDNEELDKYIEFVRSALEENHIQADYADGFIRKSIDSTYDRQYSAGKTISEYVCTYLKSKFSEDNYSKFFSQALKLTQWMNGASYSFMFSMAQKFEISKIELRQIAIDAGYKDTSITFPKIPIVPSDYKNILDFNEDLICGNYEDDGKHVLVCRLVPAIIAYVSRTAGYDYRKEIARIREYVSSIEKRGYNFPRETVYQFVVATMDAVYSKSYSMNIASENITAYIRQLPERTVHMLLKTIVTTAQEMNSVSWNALYELIKEKITLEKLEYIVFNESPYGKIDLGIKDNSQTVKYLKVLGLTESATRNDIVKAYKTLSLKFHPDTIASKGLDDEFLQFAKNRFIEIKDAYDYLKGQYT